jgi:hypothetical protein
MNEYAELRKKVEGLIATGQTTADYAAIDKASQEFHTN